MLRARLKAGDVNWLPKYAWRVREQATQHAKFPEFFNPQVVLIPVPGSAPLVKGALWVPDRVASAMAAEGLGHVWQGLRRVSAVRKSATAPVGERPTVQDHYDSLAVKASLVPPTRIVLVDDVITKGRTLLAAASRMREAFPDAEIRAFALLRTMGLVPEVAQLLDPCVGEIKWTGGDAEREP
jgi:predicted amidophosphoribosyltransferase